MTDRLCDVIRCRDDMYEQIKSNINNAILRSKFNNFSQVDKKCKEKILWQIICKL